VIDAIRSEWIKLRSARSNFVLLILATAEPVAMTLLLAFTVQPEDVTAEDTFGLLLVGDYIGQLLLGVLGVLVIGQEYRHTTIRVTFTADPKRTRVMTAKAVVVAATGLVVGGVATVFSYVLGNAILTSRDMELVLEGSTQLRALAGAVILFALYGLVGLGLGAVIRATAGAITLLVVWPLIVESIISGFFPKVGRWLPFTAGSQLMSTSSTFDPAEALTPRSGGLLFTFFALVVLLVGSGLVVRRDA
jgi:ABC-2 type transport system permease protein